MKKLPLNIANFEDLITKNYIYVDKTRHIYEMLNEGKYYFLARPRRFGKSLLISTLEAFFLNKRELFRNLWLDKQDDITWQTHPIIRLDFSKIPNHTSIELTSYLAQQLHDIAATYGKKLISVNNASVLMDNLITQLATIDKVVVLIDEYDRPIIDRLSTPNIAYANREIMHNFYSVIKSQEANLRFVFLTGVTRFAKVSIFSGMNNLTDLSLYRNTATLLGYTQEELENYFADFIMQQAAVEKKTIQETLDAVRTWYNGYRFTDDSPTVYNPFSVVSYLRSTKLKNYWFESGSPTFLIEQIIKKEPNFWSLNPESLRANDRVLSAFDIENLSVPTLFFQTGYLTIKSYDPETRLYSLCYPNREVAESVQQELISVVAHQAYNRTIGHLDDLNTALVERNIKILVQTLQSLIASIPYQHHIKHESYYHSLMHLTLSLLVKRVNSEMATSNGRIDIVLEMPHYLYIIEIKFDTPAQAALDQIKEKRYFEPYMNSKKPVTLLGLSFNYEKKRIKVEKEKLVVDWAEEVLSA